MKRAENLVVFDLECDGLDPTKIHCFSWDEGGVIRTTYDPKVAQAVFDRASAIAGHNIVIFDLPVLEKLWGVKPKCCVIDTLYLSYYLYPLRQLHGLEWWGQELGVDKPVIKDWHLLSREEYTFRCESDVRINKLLWEKQKAYLSRLYNSDEPECLPIVSYLMFKASCAREQERSKWRLDIPWCQAALAKLEAEQQPKIDALRLAMPKVQKRQLKQPPSKPFKKDGTLSVEGAKWRKLLREQGLTNDHQAPIYVVTKEEDPNPGSPDQIKDWLFSLGWKPMTFKFVKDDDGSERQIPQVKLPHVPDLCPSVLELAEDVPVIEELQGLSVLKHRIGILKGFLENVDAEGFLRARVQGLTNTLRFKHTTIVNLPSVDKPYGEEIRGCLIARDGNELCGSDMIALENKTGDHYIYDLDPSYVIEKTVPGYDSHTEMCVIAGLITSEEEKFYKWYKGKK